MGLCSSKETPPQPPGRPKPAVPHGTPSTAQQPHNPLPDNSSFDSVENFDAGNEQSCPPTVRHSPGHHGSGRVNKDKSAPAPGASLNGWVPPDEPGHGVRSAQSGKGASMAGSQSRGKGYKQPVTDPGIPMRPCGPSMPVSWHKGDSVGSGSFGNVYIGLNNDTGELLAIKEVTLMDDSGNTQRKEAVEQLEHEVSLLSGLDHPNIVRYVGTMREGTSLLIFLEYVPGGSIASLLSRFGRLKESVICVYTRQLLSGLAYLHAQRTVHRDVKGANLLVETTGRVKLADFGMAKQMVEDASFTKSFKGSAFWMAPEVIRQQGHGMAADIWSLGCTVLEMATGKPPWTQCGTQVQAIFKIASSQDLPAIPDTLSPQATEFVLLCLQRNPADRPSAESLLNHPFVTFKDTSAVPALRSMTDYRYLGSSGAHPGAHQPLRQRQGHAFTQQPYAPHRSGAGQPYAKGPAGKSTAPPMGKTPSGHKADSDMARKNQAGMGGGRVSQDSLIHQVLGKAGVDPGIHDAPTQPLSKQSSDMFGADETLDFTAQPSNFKVRGLLSLSQLPLLAQNTLPVVHVSQLYARPATDPERTTPPQ